MSQQENVISKIPIRTVSTRPVKTLRADFKFRLQFNVLF